MQAMSYPSTSCSESADVVTKLGQFAYEQWKFSSSHSLRREDCRKLYKNTPLIVKAGSERGYTENVTKEFTHDVTVLSVSGQRWRASVKEKVGGKASLGGSCFRVEAHGLEPTLCISEDHFNGTYFISCPLFTACVNITVQLEFINFDAYSVACLAPLDVAIFDTQWCPMEEHRTKRNPCDHSRQQHDSFSGGRWRHYRNYPFQWFEHGRQIPTWSEKDTLRCLKSLNSVHLIGDSHLRFIQDYLLDIKTGRPPVREQMWASFNKSDIYLWWADFSPSAAKQLRTLQTSQFLKVNITKRDVVIFSTGAWDMLANGMAQFFESFKMSVIPQLRQFSRDPMWSRATLVYVTSSPFPPHRDMVKRRGYRNDFSLAAINHWVRLKMREMNITVVDAFDIIQLRSDENVCRGHYICYENTDDIGLKKQGSVGFKVVDALLENICSSD